MKTLFLSFLTFISFFLNSYSQTAGDFRSFQNGNWTTVTTWARYDGTTWVNPAPSTPVTSDGVITIQTGHIVTINSVLSMDQVVIGAGGTLTNTGGTLLTIANSGMPAGSPELIINGTFIEDGSTSVSFNPGATWAFGFNGTYVKTRATASNNWQGAYEGGIINIPATSNWILRKVAAANPMISTIGAVYGNLIIENNFGTAWTTAAGSTFTGGTLPAPFIKGNLDLGGTGSNTVNFLNQHTIVNPTQVLGNVIIRAGNTFQNTGTGLEVQGNLTVNGTMSYSGTTSRLRFTGSNSQSLTNTGTLGIYIFEMNKPSNALTLNSPITVDNTATFTSGTVNSTSTNLFILNTNATTTGASNNSFVNGPVRYLGIAAMTFPVGKSASYRPIALGNTSMIGGIIWSENFGTTCAHTGYVTANGTWTITNTGVNDGLSNIWYISSREQIGAGNCGVGCTGLLSKTLHMGPAALLGGDGGAKYFESGSAGCGSCSATDKRIESPVINCTGSSSIPFSFDYIEFGEGTNDNATLWYFDGSVWSQLVDLPKTPCCGGICNNFLQGSFTNFSTVLPASANNNPNVRIGFRWVNNGNGIGTDPSFAVDNIILGTPLPPTSFTAEYFPTNPQVPYGNLLVPTLNTLSNCEYWILDRNASTDSRTVTLSWNAASCNNTAYTSFQVARYDGISTWQDHDGTVSGNATAGTVVTPAVVTSFSPFAIAFVPIPLPIELLQFNGTCIDGKVKLSWQTASELNNDYFTIEKSIDLKEWFDLRTIDGAGNSNTILSYEMYDMSPSSTAYYRLKQTDFNGQSELFDPIYVHCEHPGNEITIYPNPSTGMVNIAIPDGSLLQSIEIYTSLGQHVYKLITGDIKGAAIQPVDLSQLQAGTYYLRIQLNGEWITKPINIIK